MDGNDAYARVKAAVQQRMQLAETASPGPWFGNSYSAVFSGPLNRTYDAWVEPLVRIGHELERYGHCEPCGDWKPSHLAPSPSLGHGCRYFDEEYERDPNVLHVPSHHGDTSTGRHRADCDFIEANGPDVVIRHCKRDLMVLERHLPDTLGGAPLSRLDECRCGNDWPCPEFIDLAEAYGIESE